jgi:predicted RNase H-like HicB family nuclease
MTVECREEERHMAKEFSVIMERDAEGYYVGTVPALRGCHSQARSLDELMLRIREAVDVCLEAQGDSLEPLDFVGVQTISVVSGVFRP